MNANKNENNTALMPNAIDRTLERTFRYVTDAEIVLKETLERFEKTQLQMLLHFSRPRVAE